MEALQEKPPVPAEERVIQLEAQVADLEKRVVSGFWHDDYPSFRQGIPTHEVEEDLTAGQANSIVERLRKLEVENADFRKRLGLPADPENRSGG
jgi:hypothetical protein